MKSSSCSYKLLDKAHIGVHVRMTGDRSTKPFDNVPMKDMKILKYDKMGFEISHPALPKQIYVDFKQLPLTKLTIVNGVIKDEITFVENIVQHEMELIKTDMLDYIELLDIRNREKDKTFVTLSKIKPGDVVKSALCESSAPMIYLGTWFTKELRSKTDYSSYYRSGRGEYTYINNLCEVTPKRAFFLITSASGKVGKYSFLNYPITSKVILTMEPMNTTVEAFTDVAFNEEYIDTNYLQYDYYHKVSVPKKVLNVEGYEIVRGSYYHPDAHYISLTKEKINENAKALLEKRFGIKIERGTV